MNKIQASAAVAVASIALAGCAAHATAPRPDAATPHPHAATAPPGSNRPTTGVVAGAPPQGIAPACGVERSWGTGPRQGGHVMTRAPLYLVRAGRHECYDRIVFDLNGGQAVGYAARYVPIVHADPSDLPVPVRGRAVLEVVIRGPIYGTDTQGHQPGRNPPKLGDDLVSTSGLPSVTGVKYAGSFEGLTVVAVGVRDVRPFRVWARSERDYRHVVVDIAH
jgi:hypothetical protein